MGMAVDARRLTMCSPSGVRDSRMRNKGDIEIGLGVLNELLEHGNFSDFLERKNLALLVSVNCYTCRIIATVLKTRKTYKIIRLVELPIMYWNSNICGGYSHRE